MLKRIVVPLDGSELSAKALPPARALAERTGAPVLLMTARWAGHDEARALALLEHAATAFTGTDVGIEVVRNVLPAIAIPDTVDEPGTLVCMSTHGHGGLGRLVLGSVAEAVVRGSDEPVLLIGPQMRDAGAMLAPGNIVVTVDGSALSELAVPVAMEWASMLGLQPWLVQALEPAQTTPAGIDASYVEGLANSLSAPDTTVLWETLHAKRPADAICDFATTLPASLVVMASHGHGGGPAALGSVSMGVVHGAPCPVLITGQRSG